MAQEWDAPAARSASVDALYRAYARPLYAFIYGMVGNRETAEDITGNVFMKALTHLDPRRAEHSSVAWLFQVARNAVNDYWRAGRGTRMVALEEARLAREGAPDAYQAAPQQAAVHAHALLDQLPESYRMVLSYRLLEGLTVAETAYRMGVSQAYVKVLQHRALRRAADMRVRQASPAAALGTRAPRAHAAGPADMARR